MNKETRFSHHPVRVEKDLSVDTEKIDGIIYISPNLCIFTVGTWADAIASNVSSKNKTAADDTSIVYVPVLLPGRIATGKGYKLLSIDLMFSIATAACDAVSAVLYKDSLKPHGTLNTAASVTTSYDSDHDSAPKRLAQNTMHRLKLTVTTPAYLVDNEAHHVELTVDAAATSVVKFYGAVAYFAENRL